MADYVSIPLSGSRVPNGMGPLRGQSTKREEGAPVGDTNAFESNRLRMSAISPLVGQ